VSQFIFLQIAEVFAFSVIAAAATFFAAVLSFFSHFFKLLCVEQVWLHLLW